MFGNPIWDLGLQFSLAKWKVGILYTIRTNSQPIVSIHVYIYLKNDILIHPLIVYQGLMCVNNCIQVTQKFCQKTVLTK